MSSNLMSLTEVMVGRTKTDNGPLEVVAYAGGPPVSHIYTYTVGPCRCTHKTTGGIFVV
jgi:hypothetical protein